MHEISKIIQFLSIIHMTLVTQEYESAFDSGPQGVDTKETHIWGPPGCGKTTYTSRQISNAVKKYGANGVLVTSFTRAAAAELVMRDLPIPKEAVGTLHSHCYRALEYPTIAEGEIPAWNREYPQFRLTGRSDDVEEGTMEAEFTVRTRGDELYAKLQILRAKMVPATQWPESVRKFSTSWEEWKREAALSDFTDLLERALRDFHIAPGDPRVIFVDEGQDLSPLQLALVRQWGRHTDHLLLAADDDQAILTFAGADPDALLQKSGREYFRHVLSQSYRVPRTVHRLSQLWIAGLTKREPKEYLPRDAEGEVRLLHRGNHKSPEAILNDAERYLAQGKSVMFLTTCSYMLEPLKRALRQRGLAFHNPYRFKRLDWNPLTPGQRGASPVDRILSYLKPRPEFHSAAWCGADLRHWAGWIRSDGVLQPGAVDAIKRMSPTDIVSIGTLDDLFESGNLEQLASAFDGSLGEYLRWWMERLPVKRRRQADYVARVALHNGVNALMDRPHLIIGTGHSVKGGEADVVYVFPDLSASGMRQWEGSRKDRDAVIRLGYVMITRARETLVICDPAGGHHMPLAALAAKVGRQA